jgi:hypothetical protein
MMTERLLHIARRERRKWQKACILMHRFLGITQESTTQITAHDDAASHPQAYAHKLNPIWQRINCPHMSAVSGSIIQIG